MRDCATNMEIAFSSNPVHGSVVDSGKAPTIRKSQTFKRSATISLDTASVLNRCVEIDLDRGVLRFRHWRLLLLAAGRDLARIGALRARDYRMFTRDAVALFRVPDDPAKDESPLIQCHSTRHPAASSVPSLQWLLLQQLHYHGSESPSRGIEFFYGTRKNLLRMINSHLGMVFG